MMKKKPIRLVFQQVNAVKMKVLVEDQHNLNLTIATNNARVLHAAEVAATPFQQSCSTAVASFTVAFATQTKPCVQKHAMKTMQSSPISITTVLPCATRVAERIKGA